MSWHSLKLIKEKRSNQRSSPRTSAPCLTKGYNRWSSRTSIKEWMGMCGWGEGWTEGSSAILYQFSQDIKQLKTEEIFQNYQSVSVLSPGLLKLNFFEKHICRRFKSLNSTLSSVLVWFCFFLLFPFHFYILFLAPNILKPWI